MSNARIFAWGWLIMAIALSVLDWFGASRRGGFVGCAWAILLCLHMGITAVALFGDRLAHPTHTNDRGE